MNVWKMYVYGCFADINFILTYNRLRNGCAIVKPLNSSKVHALSVVKSCPTFP